MLHAAAPSDRDACRFRATRGQLERFTGLLPASHGRNPALTALCVPYSLDSGTSRVVSITLPEARALPASQDSLVLMKIGPK